MATRYEKRYILDLRNIVAGAHAAYLEAAQPMLETMASLPRADAVAKINASGAKSVEGVTAAIKPQVKKKVGEAFDKMAKGVAQENAKALGETLGLKISTLGKDVAGYLETARNANIELVENALRDYATDVRKIFGDPSNFGRRVEDLARQLQDRADVSESRAELIARDQTLKTLGGLNEERQTAAGVEGYIWSTSNDERVRDEHQILEGEFFAWDQAPEPGHPGEDFQCRCVAVPYIEELAGI